MKLTYITNIRFPTEKAHGLQVAKTIDALKSLGVKVELVVPLRFIPRKFQPPKAKSFYNLDNDLNPVRLPCIDLMFLAPIEKSIDFFLYVLESLSFMLSVSLYGLLNMNDIFYTRDPYMFFLLSFMRKNLFIELHTYPSSKLGRKILKKVLNSVEGIVVTNNNLQTRLVKQGISTTKIKTIPNGADLKLRKQMISKSQARKKLSLSKSKNTVLYLGNFYPSKGVYELCKAADRLPNDYIVLLVGGSRIDRNIKPLKEFVKKNRLKNIKIIEFKDRSKVPVYLSASDVCVLPNIVTDEESEFFTTPLKMFDYMVAQRPIVASNLPAIRQILNKKTAFLVKPQDYMDLKNNIKNALEDKNNSKKIKTAYQLAKQLSWDNRAKNIIKFVEKFTSL